MSIPPNERHTTCPQCHQPTMLAIDDHDGDVITLDPRISLVTDPVGPDCWRLLDLLTGRVRCTDPAPGRYREHECGARPWRIHTSSPAACDAPTLHPGATGNTSAGPPDDK